MNAKTGIELIVDERERQISQEGWTPTHDDFHTGEELLAAAVVYMANAATFELASETPWPWDSDEFKNSTPVRNLVKAGALIAAEIDRRLRAGEKIS